MTKDKSGFSENCRKMLIRAQYPGYDGEEKWIIATDIPEKELKRRFPDELRECRPYILITTAQAVPMDDFARNDDKFRHRHRRGTVYAGANDLTYAESMARFEDEKRRD